VNARFAANLRSAARRFNSIFPVILTAACLATAGCTDSATKAERKIVTAIRFHPEVDSGGMPVSVLRSSPVMLRVATEAAADERDIVSARVDDVIGGFVITVVFTPHGRMTMEMAALPHAGMRMAVMTKWTIDEKKTATRWLAAPVVNNGTTLSAFSFTPDCNREEAERIVKGINNVAVKLGNQAKPGRNKDADRSTGDAIKAYQEAR
jgi:hypothetical protein